MSFSIYDCETKNIIETGRHSETETEALHDLEELLQDTGDLIVDLDDELMAEMGYEIVEDD